MSNVKLCRDYLLSQVPTVLMEDSIKKFDVKGKDLHAEKCLTYFFAFSDVALAFEVMHKHTEYYTEYPEHLVSQDKHISEHEKGWVYSVQTFEVFIDLEKAVEYYESIQL